MTPAKTARTGHRLLPALLVLCTAACAPAPEAATEAAAETTEAAIAPGTDAAPAPKAPASAADGEAESGGVGIGHPDYDGPAPETLVEAGAVTDAAQDARIRALLGADDYALLADTAQMRTEEAGTPGLQTFAVRGLFTIMEGALQQDGEAIRVGLIQGDEVRWWSNDAVTASAPPAWFDTWRERFADKPVRLMSVPGAPQLQAGANDR